MINKMTNIHTIDASGRSLGRVASEASRLLMGKTSASYRANKKPEVKVSIINASKTKTSEKQLTTVLHEKYSGHPGGLRFKTNGDIIKDKGWKGLYELAVYGMLPSNKLRPLMMKNLTITE